jgi:transposase
MSGKRYSEEFKIEAVKQITERNYPIGQVSKRLGVTTKSLYTWIKRYSDGPSQHSQITDQQREIRDLKVQLKRTKEE